MFWGCLCLVVLNVLGTARTRSLISHTNSVSLSFFSESFQFLFLGLLENGHDLFRSQTGSAQNLDIYHLRYR